MYPISAIHGGRDNVYGIFFYNDEHLRLDGRHTTCACRAQRVNWHAQLVHIWHTLDTGLLSVSIYMGERTYGAVSLRSEKLCGAVCVASPSSYQ